VWSCKLHPSGDDCDIPAESTPGGYFLSEKRVVFPANALVPDRTYEFGVRVAREPVAGGRKVDVSMRVTVVPSIVTADSNATGNATNATSNATAPALRVVGTPSGIWSSSERLNLFAYIDDCDSNCTVTWQCVSGDLTGDGALASVALTGVNEHVLSVDRDKLTPGTKYVFRAVSGFGLTADAAVVVNSAPRGGSLEVANIADADATPLADVGVGKFLARARGFADDPDHYPLTYAFFIKREGVKSDVTMGADSPTVTVYDPLGPDADREQHRAAAGTRDAHDRGPRVRQTRRHVDVHLHRVRRRPAAPVAARRRPRPPTPEFWGRRKLLAGVDAEPGDATYYTTSQPAYTLGYNATTAARYYDALLRPVIELGAHSQIVQAADAYARVFAIEPAGVLTRDGSCRTEDPEALAVAATHAKVSSALRSARDAVPRTGARG